MVSFSAGNRSNISTALGKASLRGVACCRFVNWWRNGDLRYQDGGRPGSTDAMEHRVVLGVQLSQRAHPRRRGVRYRRRHLRGPNPTCIAQSGDVAWILVDNACCHVKAGAGCALAN